MPRLEAASERKELDAPVSALISNNAESLPRARARFDNENRRGLFGQRTIFRLLTSPAGRLTLAIDRSNGTLNPARDSMKTVLSTFYLR